MKKLIAICGLDCETCDARIATLTDDAALRHLGAAIAHSGELILASRCCYGGFSPEVKRAAEI